MRLCRPSALIVTPRTKMREINIIARNRVTYVLYCKANRLLTMHVLPCYVVIINKGKLVHHDHQSAVHDISRLTVLLIG